MFDNRGLGSTGTEVQLICSAKLCLAELIIDISELKANDVRLPTSDGRQIAEGLD